MTVRKAGWIDAEKKKRNMAREEQAKDEALREAKARRARKPVHHDVVLRVRLTVGEGTPDS